MTARNLPPNSQEVSIVEAARLVLQAQGIASGLWHVGLRMHFATTQAESSAAGVLPAGVVAVEGLVLTPVGDSGTLAVAARGAAPAAPATAAASASEGAAQSQPAKASPAKQPAPGPQAGKAAKPSSPRSTRSPGAAK